MVIGIDLGTTNSVIAVNGQVELAGDYPQGLYLEECGVTIIPTPDGDPTFASAIWEDPDQRGCYIVGFSALQKADEGEAPVLFSKRKIGTSEVIPLQYEGLTAKEAAREILKHLKSCAEKALGRPVTSCVVTHPAYFDLSQVDETRKAAEEAGFDMSLPEQMVMEPVAAALAYIRTDKRDPLHILTYDLGGGTLDVTYLERRGGVIAMCSFDGDRLLGGFNFDRELVHWIRGRLMERGRNVSFDESDPEDRGRLAQLLRIAEVIKIKLCKVADDDTLVEIHAMNLLIDEMGHRVPLLERITRREYVELIRPHLITAIECCRNTLKKADIEPGQIDEILLVGGSTYGPWVKDSLSEAFPDGNPKLFYPDLCVAAGAAIHAAKVIPIPVGNEKYQVLVDTPSDSVLNVIDITGKVLTLHGMPPDNIRITLSLPKGEELGPHTPKADGCFAFGPIELMTEKPNRFALIVKESEGQIALEHEFEICYSPANIDIATVTTVLPKPLYLETLDGLVPLAKEGVSLPAQCEVLLIRDNDNPNIYVRIFQDSEPVGGIRINDIPREGGRGSQVKLKVTVTEKNQIVGNAKIINPKGEVVIDTPVKTTFDIPEVPSIEELRNQFRVLEAGCLSVLMRSGESDFKGELAEEVLLLIRKARNLFELQPVDRQEISLALRKLKRILEPEVDDMYPTLASFRSDLTWCRQCIEEMTAKAETLLVECNAKTKQDMAGECKNVEAPVEMQEHPIYAGGENNPHLSSPQGPPVGASGHNLDAIMVTKAKSAIKKAGYLRGMLERVEKEGLSAHSRRNHRSWGMANDTLTSIKAQVSEMPKITPPPPYVMKFFSAVGVDMEYARLQARLRHLASHGRLEDYRQEIDRIANALEGIRVAIMELSEDMPVERLRLRIGMIVSQRLEPLKQDITRLGKDTLKG